jgi:23S rRNA pseudouridine1911/1915/1917 synthase
MAFERRRVSKSYLAITTGRIADDDGRIEIPIARATEGLHILMETRPAGDAPPARTSYRVLERSERHTLVQLFPETGRQHQLRVHLAAIGHPIVGDKLYGPDGTEPFEEFIVTGMTDALRARLGHDRQALHALALRLPHPAGGAELCVDASMAPDLTALWTRLGGRRWSTGSADAATSLLESRP